MNPLHKNHHDPTELDLTKPRLASYKPKWKVHQDTVYWVDIQLAQRNGLKFYQTRSNAVIFYDTLPAHCISKAIVMKSEEIIDQKVLCHLDHHRKFPAKIIGCVIWLLISFEAAKTPNESNQNPKTQLSRTERPVCGQESREEIEKRIEFDRDTLNQEKHDNVTDLTSTERPVCGHESTERCVLTPKHVERDQTSTERAVTVDQKEEHNIDFRVAGLSHSVVKKQNISEFKSLYSGSKIILIEQHFKPTCSRVKNSKEMIRELGNVELFELCETTPKVQCSHCLLYWNQGIVYCTCGQCLIDSESRIFFNKLRLDALSLLNYVLKKGTTHGARHGKTEVQR